jgi:Xaa-Pro aminopeptidase
MEKISLDNIRKPIGRTRNLADYAAAFLLSYNISDITVPENLWSVHFETLREHMLRPKIAAPLFPERSIKSPAEVVAIKHTGLAVKKAFKVALDMIRKATIDWNDTLVLEGKRLTSEMVRQQIEQIFLQHGCAAESTIVSCAEQSAQPHNIGSGLLRAGEPIVIDLYPKDLKTGYHFDMTRTIIKGTPSKEIKRMYNAVHKAQLAAINTVKAGKKAKDVHNAASAVFDSLGYKTTEDEGYVHSTGHGIGLGLHELPRIWSGGEETLHAGMVITIEPGLYYKDLGGVRIEDTLLVTSRGYANLTNIPKIFIVP